MKSQLLGLIAAFVLFGVSFPAQRGKTYTGEIMDSACAKMGSHDAMMKDDPSMKTAKECTVACVQHGSKYVLFDVTTKTIYQLDDQKKPEQFAGAKVTVTGTLDNATKTIHVSNIKAAS
jgi:hypothetical protein